MMIEASEDMFNDVIVCHEAWEDVVGFYPFFESSQQKFLISSRDRSESLS